MRAPAWAMRAPLEYTPTGLRFTGAWGDPIELLFERHVGDPTSPAGISSDVPAFLAKIVLECMGSHCAPKRAFPMYRREHIESCAWVVINSSAVQRILAREGLTAVNREFNTTQYCLVFGSAQSWMAERPQTNSSPCMGSNGHSGEQRLAFSRLRILRIAKE